jgi:peptide/nickel transport system substrate-binding protein
MRKASLLRSLIVAVALMGTATVATAQTVIVGRGSDGNSFDPPESESFEAIMMADYAFDGLVRYDGNTLKVAPGLAESWATSEDGLTWTFKLRPGVKFHDGTPVNADAVVFSFERQRDPNHPFYRKTFARWPAKFPTVTKTEKLDDITVKMTLSAPSPTLLTNLAFYVAYIVSPTAVEKNPEGFRNNPVGTGPFKFVRYQKDNFTEYARNDAYWRKPANIQRLVVRTIPDNDVRLLAIKKGELQLAYGISFSQFGEVEQDPNLKLVTSVSLGTSLLSMNVENGPFKEQKVRQAVSHAIDKDRIFKAVFFGYGEKADQMLPKEWFGYVKDGKVYEYDVEKAKALLKEAGFENGFKTTLLTWAAPRPYMPSPRDAAALVKSDLSRIGIDVDIQTLAWNTYRVERGKGTFGLALGGWISSTLDPDGIMFPLLHSSFIRPNDAINWSRWRNEKVDELLTKAGSMYDEAERKKLYEEVGRITMEQAPAVFFANPVNSVVARKELEGVFIHASNWVPLDEVVVKK